MEDEKNVSPLDPSPRGEEREWGRAEHFLLLYRQKIWNRKCGVRAADKWGNWFRPAPKVSALSVLRKRDMAYNRLGLKAQQGENANVLRA